MDMEVAFSNYKALFTYAIYIFQLRCLPRKKLKNCGWHFKFLFHKPEKFSAFTTSECELLVSFKIVVKKKKDSRHSLNSIHQSNTFAYRGDPL